MQHKFPLALLTAVLTLPLMQQPTASADHHEEKAKSKNQNDRSETLERMRQRRNAEQNGQPDQRGERGGQPGATPIMAALDRDGDGSLSEDEIRVAAASLKKLDKNNDGKLSTQEINGRSGSQRGAMAQETDQESPQRMNRGGSPADRLKQLDKNNDGKLSKDEVPERAWKRLSRADQNKDDVLDEAELKAMAERFGQNTRGNGEDRKQMQEQRMEREKAENTQPVKPKRPPSE